MALNYNLKYKKLNFFYKVLLEKEGEIIIDRQSFRLKGKGASDKGETIFFGDIKELMVVNDELKFSTWRKERFVLNGFSNLFESFLKDFFRVRNEYLAEVLFMKVGMLYHEYDGQVEVINRFGKNINKGKARIQLYEGSLLIIPEVNDCFAVYYNFLKSHEFDEDDYVLKLTLDSGSVINISKLGTMFEDVQETLESLLGKMYERVVNHLQEALPNFDAGSLLKLAYLLREGKCVQLNTLRKIHEDLPKAVEDLAFAKSTSITQEKVRWLRTMSKDPQYYLGFAFTSSHKDLLVRSWFVLALPEYNVIALGMTGNPKDQGIYFFRIVMDSGIVEEKLADKIMEINQSMYLFRFDMEPLYKNKWELHKTKYKTALRKLSFLHFLRKAYIGKSIAADFDAFKSDLDKIVNSAKLPEKNVLQ